MEIVQIIIREQLEIGCGIHELCAIRNQTKYFHKTVLNISKYKTRNMFDMDMG